MQKEYMEENTNIFSAKGILGQGNYLILSIVITIICTIYNILDKMYVFTDFYIGILFILSIAIILVYIFATIKRLRDIKWSLWLSILSIFPIFMLFLCCFPSKIEKNICNIETENQDECSDNVEQKQCEVDILKKKSNILEHIKEVISNIIPFIFVGGTIILGIVQWFATYVGVYEFIHNWFLAFILSGTIAYIPLVGTIVGIYGAYTYWGMPLFGAIFLFTVHIFIILLLVLFEFIIEKIDNK